MPNLGDGEQIKVWLPRHLVDALRQDAKDAGERHVQPIVRYILGQHYRDQTVVANLVEVSKGVA